MKSRILSIKPLLVLGFALSLLPSATLSQHYKQTNLVSNVPVTPPAKHDPVKPGEPGDGFVDVFSRHGRLITRLEHGDCGSTIAAFNPITGKFLGNVLNPDGTTLNIDGLWALGFGNGGASGPGSTLFFTAGPDNEVDGLFGTLTPIATELGEDDEH